MWIDYVYEIIFCFQEPDGERGSKDQEQPEERTKRIRSRIKEKEKRRGRPTRLLLRKGEEWKREIWLIRMERAREDNGDAISR